jgi:2'-5' RNA ligase
MLYTLAYPTLAGADAAVVEEIRRTHDPQFSVVATHFTMVFGCDAVAEPEYLDHVQGVSRRVGPVQFVCRYVMLGSGNDAGQAYVGLVPDEGWSDLSLLHDTLYRGALAQQLRLDIPFVPHMTVGAFRDRALAKRLCDDLNGRRFEIRGTVGALTVATMAQCKIIDRATFALAG